MCNFNREHGFNIMLWYVMNNLSLRLNGCLPLTFFFFFFGQSIYLVSYSSSCNWESKSVSIFIQQFSNMLNRPSCPCFCVSLLVCVSRPSLTIQERMNVRNVKAPGQFNAFVCRLGERIKKQPGSLTLLMCVCWQKKNQKKKSLHRAHGCVN